MFMPMWSVTPNSKGEAGTSSSATTVATEVAAAHRSGRDLHIFLDGLGLVATKSSCRDPHGFLDGLGPVVVQAALPLIQCRWPWAS
jgi:hypothetical protein